MPFWSSDEIKAAKEKIAADKQAEHVRYLVEEAGYDEEDAEQEAGEIDWK